MVNYNKNIICKVMSKWILLFIMLFIFTAFIVSPHQNIQKYINSVEESKTDKSMVVFYGIENWFKVKLAIVDFKRQHHNGRIFKLCMLCMAYITTVKSILIRKYAFSCYSIFNIAGMILLMIIIRFIHMKDGCKEYSIS